MDFHSEQKTIKEIFTSDKKYIIPRFQREYSWTIDELTELWKDILTNIQYLDDRFVTRNYFVGSLVMVGDQSSSNLQVVDGQQRLTSITILFSALVQTYKDLDEEKKRMVAIILLREKLLMTIHILDLRIKLLLILLNKLFSMKKRRFNSEKS